MIIFLPAPGGFESVGMSKPDSVQWNLYDHRLIVLWKFSMDEEESLLGFYVSLCQVNQLECEGSDYVHVSKEDRTATIVGLAVESFYKLKVWSNS